jgi:hypothetical protein
VRLALLLDHVRHCRHGASTGLVDDLEAHREELLLLRDEGDAAREHVVAAARPGMGNELDGTRRLETLGVRGSGRRANNRYHSEQYSYSFHKASSVG